MHSMHMLEEHELAFTSSWLLNEKFGANIKHECVAICNVVMFRTNVNDVSAYLTVAPPACYGWHTVMGS